MDKKKIAVKNTNVKVIFDKMEYGEVFESTHLAKVWLKNHMEVFSYLDNKNEPSKGSSALIKDVNTEEKLCNIFFPLKGDTDKIILKAKQNNSWYLKKWDERAILINRLADEINKNSNLICQLEICLRGILSKDTKTKALPLLIDYLQYYSSWAVKELPPKDLGVAVCLISDNSFLGFLGCILGPALAAGYNLILQTEPKISPIILLIIELAESIGIPEGTIKLLPHQTDIDSIFTNENVTLVSVLGDIDTDLSMPRRKMFLAITNSKSPMIIFNTADIDSACDSVVDAAWGYQGLPPWSVNTLLVQEDILQCVIEKLKYRLSKVKMSSATNKSADVSYPSDSNAIKQLHAIINEAKLQGIDVFQNIEKADVFQPTLLIGGKVFVNNVIKDDDKTAVVTILPFRTANEAINLANNTRYGFGASVWTENIGLSNEVAKGLNVSNVWINSHGSFASFAAFTPYKKSGYGIFGGFKGFLEFFPNNFHCENPRLGLFSKEPLINSESLLNKHVYKCLGGNDFHNVVMAAKKGYQNWSKATPLVRSQFLRTVANEISHNSVSLRQVLNAEQDELNKLIQILYGSIISLTKEDHISQTVLNLRSYYDPVGVVTVEAPNTISESFVHTILGAILFGNAVIVLTFSSASDIFCKELSKCMAQCNIMPGVFSVITNCNNDVLKAALCDKEIDLYIEEEQGSTPKIKNMQRFYSGTFNEAQLLNHIVLIKNVWCNIGNSFL